MAARQSRDNINRYKMRQKAVAIGDDFYIENEIGERVFHIDGKVITVRDTLVFEDMRGRELCRIKEQLLKIRDTMNIEDPDGNNLATIKKDLINILHDHWTIKIQDGPDLEVKGNILDFDYRIREGRKEIARVSKKLFRVRDSYGVEVQPGQNDVLILAITVALDMMVHD